MKYCEICGFANCKDPMVHLDEEDLMSLIMDDCPTMFCPECGMEHDAQEPDADPSPCEEDGCSGKVRHPQQVLEII